MNDQLPTLTREQKIVQVLKSSATDEKLLARMTPEAKARRLSPQVIKREMWFAMQDNPKLKQCTERSIVECCCQALQYGFHLGGPLAEAYVVPRKDRACLDVGYRGYMRWLVEGGAVTDIAVEYVYEGDTFERRGGLGGEFVHIYDKSKDREKKAITHVYSEFRMADGNVKRFTMTVDEINAHAARFSKSFDDPKGPWKSSWKAMASKTVLKMPVSRGYLPITFKAPVDELDLDEAIEVTPFDDGGEIQMKPLNVERLASDLKLAKNYAEVNATEEHYLGCVMVEDESTVRTRCEERRLELEVTEREAAAAK